MYVGYSDLFSVRFADGGLRVINGNAEIKLFAHKVFMRESLLQNRLSAYLQDRFDLGFGYINDEAISIE